MDILGSHVHIIIHLKMVFELDGGGFVMSSFTITYATI